MADCIYFRFSVKYLDRIMLLFCYLLFNHYILFAFGDANATDGIYQLIVTSERWFSIDAYSLNPKDFTIFLQKDNSSKDDSDIATIYVNEENPEIVLRNKHFDNGDPFIVLAKGEDGLHPSQNMTYVVLRQVVTHPKRYTAHLAYIRQIDGKDDVEWDNYNPCIKIENLNFVAAFCPYDSKLDSVVRKFNAPSAAQHLGLLKSSPDLFPFALFTNRGIPENVTENSIRKDLPIFAQLEASLLQEPETFPSTTTPANRISSSTAGSWKLETSPIAQTRKSDDTTIATTERDLSSFRIRLKCPSDSGAILVGRKCFCPPGTKKIHRKCVKHGRKNSKSEEEISIVSNEDKSTLLNVNFHCPPESGSVLLGRKCVCPEGSALKDNKCIDLNKISGNETGEIDIQQNNRVLRNVVPIPQKKYNIVKAIGGMGRSIVKVPVIPAPVAPKGRSLIPIVTTQATTPTSVIAKNMNIGVARSFFNAGRAKTALVTEDQSLKVLSNPGSKVKTFKFEDSTPFTGILTCEYERPNEQNLALKANTSDSIDTIVYFYLSSLRGQCRTDIEANTLRLFEKRILSVEHNFRVKFNSEHPITKKRVLSISEWNDVISGIFLAIYSEAYRDHVEKWKPSGVIGNATSPDGKEISHSIYTLTLMVDNAMKLLNTTMKFHAIKFINSLTSAINERLLKVFKEKEQLVLDCLDCDKEQLIVNQNEIQLRALLVYIRQTFVNVLKTGVHKTFVEYYLSVLSPQTQQSTSTAQGRSLSVISPQSKSTAQGRSLGIPKG